MSSALRSTPLLEQHQALGAKIVDFAGWQMPIHYGSQTKEHTAVRTEAGMFDVSHMLNVEVVGADAQAFLRYLLANDVAKLTVPGKALYTCLLNPQGGVIDDLIVYYFSERHYQLVVNAGCAEKDVAWIQRVARSKNYQVQITPRTDWAMIAVQGPKALAAVQKVIVPFAQAYAQQYALKPEPGEGLAQKIIALKPFTAHVFHELMIARTGYTGEDGVEIIVPASVVVALWQALLAENVHPCGLGARDTLRLEAGMNLYGQEMDELVHPAQAGLTWTVALKDERDFIGRQAITQFPGADLQLYGLRLVGKGVIRSHMEVQTAYGTGEVTSGTMSPTLNVSIALARLPSAVQIGDTVQVIIRDKPVEARVCPIPFVRNGAEVQH